MSNEVAIAKWILDNDKVSLFTFEMTPLRDIRTTRKVLEFILHNEITIPQSCKESLIKFYLSYHMGLLV